MNKFCKLFTVLLVCLSFSINNSFGQTNWIDLMKDPNSNFFDVQNAFNQYYIDYVNQNGKELKEEYGILKKKERESQFEVPGFEQFKRWEWFMEPRVSSTGERFNPSIAYTEYLTKVKPFLNQSRSSTWSLVGPTTQIPTDGGAGRINFVRFLPGNNNTIFAGAPSGGLWKSTDGGSTWSTNTDDLAVIGCSDIAIDPVNTNIMYLATGDVDAGDTYSIGVLKTTDGGITWNTTGLSFLVSAGETVNRILINPNDPTILIATTSDGIYRSTNSGTNWTHVVATGNFKDAQFKPGDPNTVYACSNKFYKSTNGGLSFNQVTSVFSSSVDRMAIAVSANNSNIVYAVTANTTDYGLEGFYQSTNSGTSFTLMNSTYDILGFSTSGGGGGGQGWYDLAIDASPLDANSVVVGGINTYKSTNGGSSWTIHGAGYGFNAKIHPDVHEVIFAPGTSNCFVGCDGGVFKTTNSGSSFTDLSDGLQIAQPYRLSCAATNANIIMSGWQDNGTNRYSSGAWEEVLGGDGMETIISWASSQTMYGELYYGEIYKSTNGGNSFGNNPIVGSGGTAGTKDEDGDWVTPYIQDPVNSSTLYVGKTKVYKSTNSGTSWTALGTVSAGSGKIKAIAVATSNTSYIYCAKKDRFYASTNGGTAFTDRTSGIPVTSGSITYIAVSNTDPSKVWVSLSGYSAANKVMYSSNAGQTWSNISTGLPNVPANTIVYVNGSTSKSLYCGTDIGVFYRDDNTGSWIPYTDGLPNVIVNELEIHYGSSKIRAATYGRGIWECDLYTASLSAPTASFISNVTGGCAPLIVQYTSTSVFANNYSWNFQGGAPATSSSNTATVVYNTSGTYQVKLVVSNALGSDSVIQLNYITVGPSLGISATGDNIICFAQNNGYATASVTGGTAPFTFIWSNGATTSSISNLASGGYTVTVTDGLGCIASVQVTITQPPALIGNVVSTPDNGSNNGSINLSPQGGTQPYSYAWSTGDNTQDISGLAAGSYSVTITDASGCVKVVTTTVSSNVGIAVIDEVNSWLIYPNPTHNWLSIDASKQVNAKITIYNLLGQEIADFKMENSNSIQFRMTDLPNGEYWLKITTDKGVAYRKIMKS